MSRRSTVEPTPDRAGTTASETGTTLLARYRERDGGSPIEGLLHRSTVSFRRRLVAGVALAVLLLAGISIALAWRQYDDEKSRTLTDMDARVVAVSALVDTYVNGQIATLDSIARAPAVVGGRTAEMRAYFTRVQPAGGTLFTGGIGWIDRRGSLRASNIPGASQSLRVSGREYFQRVLATDAPHVSAGLSDAPNKKAVVVIAVPTHSPSGQVSGVLAGAVLLKSIGESTQALHLGYSGLQVIDRDGQLLLPALATVANRPLYARLRQQHGGFLSSSPGLDGHGDDALAFATSGTTGWLVVLERPRSELFASAQRALVLDFTSIGVAVLLVFGLLGIVLWRSRRETETRDARARSWTDLTRALASAATPGELAEALLASLAGAFDDAVAIVSLSDGSDVGVRVVSKGKRSRRIAGSATALESTSQLAEHGPGTWLLNREEALREVHELSGRRFRALHGLPILDRGRRPVGSISLVFPATVLEASEWALLGAFADQAGQAFERAALFEREHDLSVRLQRSLLPDRLPSTDGVELEGHYRAGTAAVEVGGDWYDAVRRPDGLVQICIGDVSGKGIDAATVMGRQRTTFQVCAHDCVSPAEIIRRMIRHADGDEMITVACVSLDSYTGEIVYSCAGHPPPLLVDRGSGRTIRLDRASAPPIGVAEFADVVEARLPVTSPAVLAMYTDGLIERRGANIDEGIDFLASVLADAQEVTPDGVLRSVGDALGEPDDDVALLVVRLNGIAARFEAEVPAEPASLPVLRRRLRAWLSHQQLDDEESSEIVLAVSEACNNAIEHAYRDHQDGRVKLMIAEEGETLRILVEDHGSWRAEEPGGERGRGIVLMQRLMGSATIETDADGTRVTLEPRLRRTGAGAARAAARERS